MVADFGSPQRRFGNMRRATIDCLPANERIARSYRDCICVMGVGVIEVVCA
jgi:hypothetical protein